MFDRSMRDECLRRLDGMRYFGVEESWSGAQKSTQKRESFQEVLKRRPAHFPVYRHALEGPQLLAFSLQVVTTFIDRFEWPWEQPTWFRPYVNTAKIHCDSLRPMPSYHIPIYAHSPLCEWASWFFQ